MWYNIEEAVRLLKEERAAYIMQKALNLQEIFLNQVRKVKTPVTVFLVNGFQIRGQVTGFDSFTVVLDVEGRQQLVYKHAISTIQPVKAVKFAEDGSDQDGL